uniref:LOW QUALITY PROTEIN: uncharacterized protein LOC108037364 n=1 Tax=Drosophila rhopaloa TaxID=1041015 RepID=A0A6P4DV03_DRORH
MGVTKATPYSEAESKAFAKFLKIYGSTRGDMDKDEILRSAENAWGKLLPVQKKHFEVKPREIRAKKMAIAARKSQAAEQKNKIWHSKKKALSKHRFSSKSSEECVFLYFLREYQKGNINLYMEENLKSISTKELQNLFKTLGKERLRRGFLNPLVMIS